ncbi:hypothetical protein [Streptomyces sp. NPDC005181]|uniref:hypothetical protein n=1 Tax=Streptomyces sp. NPDC005181 TaxID=3156869 RepID=UPI0033A093B3
MTSAAWTSWSSREALSTRGRTRPRAAIAWSVRVLVLTLVLWGTFSNGRFGPWEVMVGLLVVIGCAWAARAFFRAGPEHRLWPSLGRWRS